MLRFQHERVNHILSSLGSEPQAPGPSCGHYELDAAGPYVQLEDAER